MTAITETPCGNVVLIVTRGLPYEPLPEKEPEARTMPYRDSVG